MLHKKGDALVSQYYESLTQCVPHIPDMLPTIEKSISTPEKEYLKESLYSADTWLFQELLDRLSQKGPNRHHKYSDYSILGILASLKDTLFGFILYYSYMLQEAEKQGNIYIGAELFMKIYIIDVLNITEEYYSYFASLIHELASQRKELWSLWI